MISLTEAAGHPARFASLRPHPTGSARPSACGTAEPVDSATYQAMLADLGLTPDPRLCVPAVRI
ncbi:MAG: hypothetical protein ACR2KV_05165 [Solirubrobacteraceae bacterium]